MLAVFKLQSPRFIYVVPSMQQNKCWSVGSNREYIHQNTAAGSVPTYSITWVFGSTALSKFKYIVLFYTSLHYVLGANILKHFC